MFYKIKKKLYLIVSIFILIFSSFHVLIAATYYIALTGNDLNDGSITSPWLTIGYAITHTEPGDTIMVREGTYFQGEVWIRGNYGGASGQIKTLMAYPGENVTLDGNRILIEVDYVRIQGFILDKKPLYIT